MSEEKNERIQSSDTAPVAESRPSAPVEVVDVCFRNAGKSYFFSPVEKTYSVGDRVIVETARGLEIGNVVIANHKIDCARVVSPLRKILRLATAEDLERAEKNRKAEMNAAVVCRQKIEDHKLEMHLVDAEYTFDNSKLIFYFTAESRVDFRELVKDLASVFRTRIELRQIGIRDEARMIGGLGACGRPFCCTTFLSDFVQVSIKMAKEQNFSLNSAKISGACGRLMCCLRYEHEIYEEALRTTPSNGAYVSTPSGNGTVIESRPLLQIVKVRLDDKPESPKLFTTAEITVLRAGKGRGQKPENPPQQS